MALNLGRRISRAILEAIREDKMDVKGEYERIRYSRLELDLGNARTNEEIKKVGDMLIVEDITGTVSIKLNETTNNEIKLHKNRKICGQFSRFFITNSAQTGQICHLLIGKGITFDIEPESKRRVKLISDTLSWEVDSISGLKEYNPDECDYTPKGTKKRVYGLNITVSNKNEGENVQVLFTIRWSTSIVDRTGGKGNFFSCYIGKELATKCVFIDFGDNYIEVQEDEYIVSYCDVIDTAPHTAVVEMQAQVFYEELP